MKQNGLLVRLEQAYDAKYRLKYEGRLRAILQLGQDAGMLAAKETLGLGPKRAAEYAVAYRESVNEIIQLVNSDIADGDEDYWNTRNKVDAALKKICGENFTPWEERYGTK